MGDEVTGTGAVLKSLHLVILKALGRQLENEGEPVGMRYELVKENVVLRILVFPRICDSLRLSFSMTEEGLDDD